MFGIQNTARKFIDLIWRSSAKWAVWNPPCESLQVGDYGKINKETGKFEWCGNIYKNPELHDLVEDQEPTVTEVKSEEIMTITSLNAHKVDFEAKADLDALDAKAIFKCKWNFGSSSGAVLVIHKPQHTSLPHDMNINMIATHPALRGMNLVTSVTTCPAYALYLASKDNNGVSLALCARSPIPHTPGTNASGNIELNWVHEGVGGFYRAASDVENSYTVLYDMKECKRKTWYYIRDSPVPEATGLDKLEPSTPSWDLLGEDGEEKPACTYQVFNDDDDNCTGDSDSD